MCGGEKEVRYCQMTKHGGRRRRATRLPAPRDLDGPHASKQAGQPASQVASRCVGCYRLLSFIHSPPPHLFPPHHPLPPANLTNTATSDLRSHLNTPTSGSTPLPHISLSIIPKTSRQPAMAQARMQQGGGGRPGGSRFAQFKLVLLGTLPPLTIRGC